MGKEKPKLRLRPLGAAPIRRPGDPLPEPPPEDLVPELRGETVKLNFMADAAIVDVANEHVDRLHRLSPYFVTTASDAIRSLIMEGGRSYAAKFRDEPRNGDTDDEK
jgi:hypothetical protein